MLGSSIIFTRLSHCDQNNNNTSYFSNYFSLQLLFNLIFIPQIDLWSLNVLEKFQLCGNRIRRERYNYFICVQVAGRPKFSVFNSANLWYMNSLCIFFFECFEKESIQKACNNASKIERIEFIRQRLIILKTENSARKTATFDFTVAWVYGTDL